MLVSTQFIKREIELIVSIMFVLIISSIINVMNSKYAEIMEILKTILHSEKNASIGIDWLRNQMQAHTIA